MADNKSTGFMLLTVESVEQTKCSAMCPEVQKDGVIKGCLLGTSSNWLRLPSNITTCCIITEWFEVTGVYYGLNTTSSKVKIS